MPSLPYATTLLREKADATAPDGMEVRLLVELAGGGLAHFTLPAGQVSRAVRHRTVEEMWFVTAGEGELWRRQGEDEDDEDVVTLIPGVAFTLPLGTWFQMRAGPAAPLRAVAVTMPPWPGEDEAVFVEGPWRASL